MRLLSGLACALCVGLFSATLGGCGYSSGVSPTPNAALTAERPLSPRAPLSKHANNEVLVYAVGGCGGTCVLSYTQGTVIGTLPTSGSAICSNGQGDVFIASDNAVVAYHHGDSTPFETLSLPGTDAHGCSVDPTTSNLAIDFLGQNADIAVFAKSQGMPTLYSSGVDSSACGYDSAGNLFVSGYSTGVTPGFSELPAENSLFMKLSIPESVGPPGQVQWDGKYITYEGRVKRHPRISRLTISGSAANVAKTINIKGISRWPMQSWIYNSHVLIPYSNKGDQARNLGLWDYPKGNSRVKTFDFGSYQRGLHINGVTVSEPDTN